MRTLNEPVSLAGLVAERGASELGLLDSGAACPRPVRWNGGDS